MAVSAETFSSLNGPLTSSQSQATTLSSSVLSGNKRKEMFQLVLNTFVCVYASVCVCDVRDSRLPSITVELVGKEISWNFGETMATGGLFIRGSVRWKTRN